MREGGSERVSEGVSELGSEAVYSNQGSSPNVCSNLGNEATLTTED